MRIASRHKSYPLTQRDFSLSWSPIIVYWLFCIQYQYFISNSGACTEVLFWVWMKINLIWFIEGVISAPLGKPIMQFTLNEPTLKCSSFKPQHYLRACSTNLPDILGAGCKITNSQPNFMNSVVAYLGPNSFQHLLACQNKFDPQWTNIEFSVF